MARASPRCETESHRPVARGREHSSLLPPSHRGQDRSRDCSKKMLRAGRAEASPRESRQSARFPAAGLDQLPPESPAPAGRKLNSAREKADVPARAEASAPLEKRARQAESGGARRPNRV